MKPYKEEIAAFSRSLMAERVAALSTAGQRGFSGIFGIIAKLAKTREEAMNIPWQQVLAAISDETVASAHPVVERTLKQQSAALAGGKEAPRG